MVDLDGDLSFGGETFPRAPLELEAQPTVRSFFPLAQSMSMGQSGTNTWCAARTLNPRTLATRPRFEMLEYRLEMDEKTQRKKAATMLLLGATSGFLGFAFAFLLGTIRRTSSNKFLTHQGGYCLRYDGKKFANTCYFPSTVSEMVHNSDDPTGKIFFFFEFIGAIMIFFSWYPMHLRSVYVGDDYKVPGLGLAWVHFRQYVPGPGMMMLSVITTVPFAQADILDLFCIAFHLLGAALMFVGYFLSEAATIGWGPIAGVPKERRHFHGRSVTLRSTCLHLIVASYVIFCVLQVLLSVMSSESSDQWHKIPQADCKVEWGIDCDAPQLMKPADGWVKHLKMLSFGSEVICGVALILSHLVIWYYCEERHYDLADEVLHMSRAKPIMEPHLRDMISQVSEM